MTAENLPSLFKPDEIPESPPTKFCRTCKHRERWLYGGSFIQYCGVRKCNRTFNGLMKTKASNPACIYYESDISKQAYSNLLNLTEVGNSLNIK